MRHIMTEIDAYDKVDGAAEETDEDTTDSVDNQIDALLIKYESQSTSNPSNDMMEILRRRSLMFLLEADQEEAEPTQAANKPNTTKKMSLDVESFVGNVARLVLNAHKMLDVETAIIKRARQLIEKNYDVEYVDEFDSILDTQYQFNLSGDKDVMERPIAAGAATKSA